MNKTKRYASIFFMIVMAAILSTNISTVKASDNPAHVAVTTWTFSDGFEGSSIWNRWSCWQTIVNPENFCGTTTHKRSGLQGGFISGRSGWSDIRTWESLDPFITGRTLTCFAQIYLYVRDVAIPDGLTAQLEVIDADTGQYISTKQINSTSHTWQLIKTANWNPTHKNILVRLGIIGVGWATQNADLDDLMVRCTY
jgi:hypothetical protein